jgi:hypothetical protein
LLFEGSEVALFPKAMQIYGIFYFHYKRYRFFYFFLKKKESAVWRGYEDTVGRGKINGRESMDIPSQPLPYPVVNP